MNLKQLQYLAALHKTRSFTAAAKLCGVSQSTLSGGIAALETTLVASLVERDTQHVLFTPLGEGVVERAAPMLAASLDLQRFVQSSSQPMQGTITLAAIPSIAPFMLAQLLEKLHAQYPKLKVLVRELQTAALLAQLREGALDMGIIALPYDTAGLSVQHLFNEPLVLIAAPFDALARSKQASLATLEPERLILLQEGHCLREHTLQSCSLAERATAAIEASSLLTMVHMVEAGLGVALLPEMAIRSRLVMPAVQAGTLVALPFAKPAPQRGVALVSRSTMTQQDVLQAVAGLLRESKAL